MGEPRLRASLQRNHFAGRRRLRLRLHAREGEGEGDGEGVAFSLLQSTCHAREGGHPVLREDEIEPINRGVLDNPPSRMMTVIAPSRTCVFVVGSIDNRTTAMGRSKKTLSRNIRGRKTMR